jgi:hypothetical protein
MVHVVLKSVEVVDNQTKEYQREIDIDATKDVVARSEREPSSSSSATTTLLSSIGHIPIGRRGGLHQHRLRSGAALAWMISEDLFGVELYEQQTNLIASTLPNTSRMIALCQFPRPISCATDAILQTTDLSPSSYSSRRESIAVLVMALGTELRLLRVDAPHLPPIVRDLSPLVGNNTEITAMIPFDQVCLHLLFPFFLLLLLLLTSNC